MSGGFEQYAGSEIDPLLRSICYQWTQKVRQAQQYKREVFGIDAEECANFYNGPRSWDELHGSIVGDRIDGDSDRVAHQPDFKVKVNKTFEFVTIFGPALYYENPVRTCKPRMPVQVPWDFLPSPEIWQALMQQEEIRVRADGLRGVLLETYLNWTPLEFRLDRESRKAIDEALIKGRGCIWTELYQPPGSSFRVVRAKWESVDDLIIDPDATSLENATWIARRRCLPSWQVERDYGLRRGSIRGNLESQGMQSFISSNTSEMAHERKKGTTNDLLVFYQIWSKMGLGGRLFGMSPSMRAATEPFGDYSYVVVAENIPFPLNCPPDVYNDPGFATDPNKVFARFAWPTPFWFSDRWPVSCLDFHIQHNCAWPMAHLKAGMGELKFLNWVMSFLMGHLRTTMRDFIAVKKSVSEEIKTTLLEGKDLTLIELEATNGLITELVQFLQHPSVNGDVWKMIEAVEANFDKRVGLTELMYGDSGATQPRSATEMNIKNQNMNVRPADMAKQVEAWMAEVAQNEAMAARYHLRGADVQPLMGALGSFTWDAYVATLELTEAFRQLEYGIEAGSTQRPNKQFEVQTMQNLGQQIMPILQAYAGKTGDLGPLNNWISDLTKSLGLDPNRYMLRGVPGVPALPGAEQEPEPGGTDVAQPSDAEPAVSQ